MDFLASYVGKGLSEWPYQQISGWESSIQNFCKDLYRTAVYLNPARKDYLNLYYAHRILNRMTTSIYCIYKPRHWTTR